MKCNIDLVIPLPLKTYIFLIKYIHLKPVFLASRFVINERYNFLKNLVLFSYMCGMYLNFSICLVSCTRYFRSWFATTSKECKKNDISLSKISTIQKCKKNKKSVNFVCNEAIISFTNTKDLFQELDFDRN